MLDFEDATGLPESLQRAIKRLEKMIRIQNKSLNLYRKRLEQRKKEPGNE